MLHHQPITHRLNTGSIAQKSRSVRVGNHIIIAGTVASTPSGLIVGTNNPKAQTRCILDQIEQEIRELGGELRDVTKLNVTVSNIDHWEAVARVIGERFTALRPTNSLVVTRLRPPHCLVEIAADARVGSGGETQKFIL